MYEGFLHDINLYCIIGKNEKIKDLVHNADMWSYAHRQGNGEFTEKEQNKIIDKRFKKLRDTKK